MMTPIILMQADANGLRDLSAYSRRFTATDGRMSLINGHYYYNLNGDSAASWDMGGRLQLSAKKFTIEGWINTKNMTTTGLFIGGQNNSYLYGFFMGFTSSGKFLFSTGDGNRHISDYAAIAPNTTAHFAWVVDGIKKSLYINGNLFDTQNMTSGISNVNTVTFGYSTENNQPTGSFSDILVHQLIVWDGVKYKANFSAEYTKYNQQTLGSNDTNTGYKYLPANYNGVIADKVLIKGLPAKRKVCLYRRSTNELESTMWSDDDGNYRFDNLRPDTEYYVIALDHERNYNAVIQDMVRTNR